ncbi:protein PAXX isoform 3-T3 [Spheniscus humboldti]
MAEPAGPFRLLQAGPGRYLCYCCPGPGAGGTVYVTDALEVWAGELGARPPLGCRCQPEEHGTKLREALGRGAASLSLGEGKATLQLREEDRCSVLDLFKLPVAEARSQLQALVFGMAGRVESLERRLEAIPLSQQREKAVPPWPHPRWFLLTGPRWSGQERWAAEVLPSFFYLGWPVPRAGQGLHLTTSGRRDPAWDQRMQCHVSVQKHNLDPVASTTPSSLRLLVLCPCAL